MDGAVPKYIFNTPLGSLETFVRVNGKIVEKEDIEVAEVRLSPVLEYSYKLHNGDGTVATEKKNCYGVHIRCATKKKIRQLTFECRWKSTSKITRGRPECDKGINALRWTENGHTVLVGTEDADSLIDRMRRRDHISPGFRHCLEEITPELDHLVFGYKDDGFIIRLTEIPANESAQVFFTITWGEHPEPESEATWLLMYKLHEMAMSSLDSTEKAW